MQMCDGHYCCQFAFQRKKHAERESVNDRAPERLRNEWKVPRSSLDPDKRCTEFLKKFAPEAVALAFVPQHRLKRVELCFGSDLKPSHLRSLTQMSLKPLHDFLPWPGFLRRAAMRRKPFFENGLLPFLKWDLIDACGDAVPERLDIVDLVVDGKIVESWRRQRQRMRHDSDYSTGMLITPLIAVFSKTQSNSVGPTLRFSRGASRSHAAPTAASACWAVRCIQPSSRTVASFCSLNWMMSS